MLGTPIALTPGAARRHSSTIEGFMLMIGFGRIFKGAAGQDRAKEPPAIPLATVYRAISSPKSSLPAEPEWPDGEAGDTRSGERFVPRRTSVTITMQSGKKVAGRIINVSQTGVAVEADFAAVGRDGVVMVGSRPVVAGRRISLGRVFLFEKPLDPKLCHADIQL